jgi:hypothetical protein
MQALMVATRNVLGILMIGRQNAWISIIDWVCRVGDVYSLSRLILSQNLCLGSKRETVTL